LLTRLNKAAAKTEKESTMDASEIMKRHPSELHPGMSADKAFAELYKNTERLAGVRHCEVLIVV
jgi:hypothetical protein